MTKFEKMSKLEAAGRGLLVGLMWGLALGVPVGIVLQKLWGT